MPANGCCAVARHEQHSIAASQPQGRVGHHDGVAALAQCAHAGRNLILGHRVDGGGWVPQHQHLPIGMQRPSQGDPLPLPAGKVGALVQDFDGLRAGLPSVPGEIFQANGSGCERRREVDLAQAFTAGIQGGGERAAQQVDGVGFAQDGDPAIGIAHLIQRDVVEGEGARLRGDIAAQQVGQAIGRGHVQGHHPDQLAILGSKGHWIDARIVQVNEFKDRVARGLRRG